MNTREGQRALYRCAAVLLFLGLGLPAYARVARGDAWGRERFSAAERMREALNARPASEHTRHDYQRVIDAYRRVYFGAPACSKADASAAAVAELQVEMGRRFDDEKILRAAIDQYSFLRREYPASKYRFDALFISGQIYKDDLDDPRQARQAFEEFLRRYPRHHLADGARQALNELSEEANKKQEAARKEASRGDDGGRKAKPKIEISDENAEDGEPEPGAKSSHAGHVTAIRHWSTPEYTRVAIDLEQQVQFESQRLAHPERIFFDLHDTRVASSLAGKSIEVDDGFLKKIRVAQFQPERTRVVLEVEDEAEYKAVLQPNPYRLIIDIRGRSANAGERRLPLTENRAKREEAVTEPIRPHSASSPSLNAIGTGTIAVNIPPATPGQPTAAGAIAKPVDSTAAAVKPLPVKKIVEADDDDEGKAEVATLEPADLRPEITSAQKASAPVPIPVEGAKTPHGTSDRGRSEHVIADQGGSEQDASDRASNSGKSAQNGRGKAKRKSSRAAAEIDVREAQPTAAGDRSLTRALGLKIGKIVIDPGHGGHDTGTIGPNGLEEKDLVLGVAKRLGKLLQSRMGAEVIYTRQDDTFIPLETRTAIANEQQADLFVSIHANSSSDRDARGVETYYLNFTSNADALEVAARENAVSDKSIHELQDLVKKIALKEKIEESREFASDVQQALHTGLAAKSPAIRDRGVKKAPFIVLIGANMPSILAEISFVSNPTDAHKLETAEYRQRIAESLYRGISRYVNGLSGVRVASRMAKREGQ